MAWSANNLINPCFVEARFFRLILDSLKHLTNKGANNGIRTQREYRYGI